MMSCLRGISIQQFHSLRVLSKGDLTMTSANAT